MKTSLCGEQLWLSSFNDLIVTPERSVLTAVCCSGYTGGHASLFLEHLVDGQTPETLLIHMGGRAHDAYSKDVTIHVVPVQSFDPGQNVLRNGLEWFKKDPATTLHHSYLIDNNQKSVVFATADKYNKKVESGRYKYDRLGGLLGRRLALPGLDIGPSRAKPVQFRLGGKRGVNCASFVIKVLRKIKVPNVGPLLAHLPRKALRSFDGVPRMHSGMDPLELEWMRSMWVVPQE